ncbi:hypothetical protein [Bacteroides sp. An19]|uniref:hypothetical protein n=1 Tax=Bacteroides sp. An19 TaxID=1965580 RepID=UPI000B37EBEC|nr:hypothetical protein [Bacteroides sp. An19]OUP37245.1 hypothetical protein B5F25_00155 [Bacteroides sp. An19]
MKKQYKIQLPKGKKVTLTNVDFKSGVMTVNVELEKDDSNIWNKMIQEYGEAICGKKEQKYEPKDGDFIYLKWKGVKTFLPYEEGEKEAIGIFKETGHDMLYCYVTYFVGDDFKNNPTLMIPSDYIGNKISNGYTSMFDEIRPATEEEKKLLIEKLAEVGKRWNEEKKCLENVRWRAKKGKLYRWVSADGYVKESTDEHGECDNCYYKSGNYFKTEEAAEKVAEQIRNIFKNSKAE